MNLEKLNEAIVLADTYSLEELQNQQQNSLNKLAINIHEMRNLYDSQAGIKDSYIKAVNAISEQIHAHLNHETPNGFSVATHITDCEQNAESEFNNKHISYIVLDMNDDNKENEWYMQFYSHIQLNQPHAYQVPKILNRSIDYLELMSNLEISFLDNFSINKLTLKNNDGSTVTLDRDSKVISHLNNTDCLSENTFAVQYFNEKVLEPLNKKLSVEHLMNHQYSIDLEFDIKEAFMRECLDKLSDDLVKYYATQHLVGNVNLDELISTTDNSNEFLEIYQQAKSLYDLREILDSQTGVFNTFECIVGEIKSNLLLFVNDFNKYTPSLSTYTKVLSNGVYDNTSERGSSEFDNIHDVVLNLSFSNNQFEWDVEAWGISRLYDVEEKEVQAVYDGTEPPRHILRNLSINDTQAITINKCELPYKPEQEKNLILSQEQLNIINEAFESTPYGQKCVQDITNILRNVRMYQIDHNLEFDFKLMETFKKEQPSFKEKEYELKF